MKSKILILENKINHANQAAEYLRTEGYEVFCCTEYQEASRLIKEISFDVAVIDLFLSHEKLGDEPSGLHFINNELKKNNIPAIIWTRHPTADIARRALKRMPDEPSFIVDFVVKADGLRALSVSIKVALGKTNKRKQNEIQIIVGIITVLLLLILLFIEKNEPKVLLVEIVVGVIVNILTWIISRKFQ